MQYHLDTIPVWEAMEQQTECPLCALHTKVEQLEIDRSLGGSVMEPEARIRVNETGICQRHHGQLFMQQNRLGHALLTDSHAKELLKKLQKLTPSASGRIRSGFFKKPASPLTQLSRELESLSSSCVICESVQTHMNRYSYTFMHLWKKEAKFKKAWEASKGVCIPHAAFLLRHGEARLSSGEQKEFAASLISLVSASLTEDEKDLEWFTLKFDYRNQDKPWGNSKNALERTINRLRGRCLGE